ncbi:MAG: alpha/beta fold hydrolase, partial [Oscillospiraceae bacterium]
MPLLKENFEFLSANGKNMIKGVIRRKDAPPYKAIIQISHGMVEHMDRYEEFMNFMAENGYVMVGHDHLGHKASVDSDDELGFFAEKDGYKCILDDLVTTASRTRKMFPGLKLVLLGHSMGSFYARVFASKYHNLIDGIIISGTGGTNPIAGVGKLLIKLMIIIKGAKYRSDFVANISFSGFLSKIPCPKNKSEWISTDPEMVQKYINDKYCSFTFTLSGFLDLVTINGLSNSEECYKNFKKDIPVYIFSGEMDPVGEYGKGVTEVYEKLKAAGVSDITFKLYKDGRHE